MLKIVLYSHAWAPLVGGVQTVTIALASGLASGCGSQPGDAVQVTLVTQTPAGNMNDSDMPFRVVRRPNKRELISLIREADVLHIANPAVIPLFLGWLLRKPVVLEHDGYQSVCPNGLLLLNPGESVCPGHFLAKRYQKCIRCNSKSMGWLRSFLSLMFTFPRRWLARRVGVNIAPTNHIGRRIALPKTRVIHHGVPKYSSLPSAASSNEEPYFAYVGRLVIEKGLPVLLRACSKVAKMGCSFRLKIVGDGTERLRLEKLIMDLGLDSQVEFLGSISAEKIPGLLAGATAVIMPSIWEDVAPLVAYEQLMHGYLVIASDIGGLGEIVDGVALKFPPGDSDALATCMERALKDPVLARDLRSKGQRRAAESFSQQRMVVDHLSVFKELAAIDVE